MENTKQETKEIVWTEEKQKRYDERSHIRQIIGMHDWYWGFSRSTIKRLTFKQRDLREKAEKIMEENFDNFAQNKEMIIKQIEDLYKQREIIEELKNSIDEKDKRNYIFRYGDILNTLIILDDDQIYEFAKNIENQYDENTIHNYIYLSNDFFTSSVWDQLWDDKTEVGDEYREWISKEKLDYSKEVMEILKDDKRYEELLNELNVKKENIWSWQKAIDNVEQLNKLFTGDYDDFERVEDLQAYLLVNQAKYDVSEYGFFLGERHASPFYSHRQLADMLARMWLRKISNQWKAKLKKETKEDQINIDDELESEDL